MRAFLLLLPMFAVACQQGGKPIDPREFFDSLEGPKVPTVHDTLLDTARSAEKQGDFKGAAQLYGQVLEKRPEDKGIMLALADAYRRNGEPDRAVGIYDSLIRKDPKLAAAKEGKGLALMAKGDFDTPAALFGEVMKTEPNRWKTLNALGILFTTRSMHPQAQQYFSAALKASPSNPSVLNNLGLSQALARNFPAAETTLVQAISTTDATSPERRRIDLNLALVYAVAGQPERAGAIAGQYFTGAALDNNRGLYAHLAKDNELARAYLNMALTESKTFYEKAWNNLQGIPGGAPPSAAPETAPAEEEPAAEEPEAKKPEPKTKRKAKPKAAKKPAAPGKSEDEGISDIVGKTDEPVDDHVPESPIP